MSTLLATVATSAVGSAAAIRQGQAAEAAGEAAQDVAELRAKQAREEGAERSHRMTAENQRRLAAMRARIAAGGTTIGGSALELLSESARRLETRNQDAFRVAALDSMNESYQGKLAAYSGSQAKSASYLRGFGTLLEGVGAYSQQTAKYRTS